jgi:protein gp37
MSDRTGIEWTDATWNPIRGIRGKWSCVKVSPGCEHCYAEALNVRFGGPAYKVGADELRLDEAILEQPLRWRRPRRIFVCSMTDLFEERSHVDWIARVFRVMAQARQHTFQVLTKRADRARDVLNSRHFLAESDGPWPLRNVWLGVSAEDQQRADERIPDLLRTPAAVRWVSLEPLLGPIDLRHLVAAGTIFCGADALDDPGMGLFGTRLDWVVVGGESGPGARPCDLAWIRSVRDQCRAAGVPCFVKQLGARPVTSPEPGCDTDCKGHPIGKIEGGALRSRKGGDPQEWPPDLRVREWPTAPPGAPQDA